MRRISSFVFCFILVGTVFAFTSKAAYAADDITGISLESEMRDMIGKGIIKGYGTDVYKPFDGVTRGQFATIVSRSLNLSGGTNVFSDVSDTSQLASGISSAYAAGIVQGRSDGTFGINDLITRAEMALMIDRSLNYLGITRTEAALDFTDSAEITDTFRTAIANNVYYGLLKGIPNGDGTYRFAAQNTATRAESAAILSRMISVAGDKITQSTTPDPHLGHTPIIGTTTVTADKMVAFVRSVNPNAQDIEEIAAAFIEIGNTYGIRADIAFCQSIIETGWFRYDGGTAVTPSDHNYSGLGVTVKGQKGNIFGTVREGVTAQMQHLYAYASKDSIPEGETLVDLRFKYVTRGIAPHWEDLSMRWAMNANYGTNILSIYSKLRNY